jgi:c-di-AMP phosphodiesterase-like protein
MKHGRNNPNLLMVIVVMVLVFNMIMTLVFVVATIMMRMMINFHHCMIFLTVMMITMSLTKRRWRDVQQDNVENEYTGIRKRIEQKPNQMPCQNQFGLHLFHQ